MKEELHQQTGLVARRMIELVCTQVTTIRMRFVKQSMEDPDIPVISLQTLAGKQIAFMSAYSMHYAGAPNISADYFGLFAGIIEEQLPSGDEGRPTVAMIANGTSGDTWLADYKRNERRKFDRFSVAEDVAAAAMKAYGTIEYLSGFRYR